MSAPGRLREPDKDVQVAQKLERVKLLKGDGEAQMPVSGGERKVRSGGCREDHVSINLGQVKRAIQRRQMEAFAEVVEFLPVPDSFALFDVLRDMRAVLSDQQILFQAGNGFVAGELVTAVVSFRAGGKNFPDQNRVEQQVTTAEPLNLDLAANDASVSVPVGNSAGVFICLLLENTRHGLSSNSRFKPSLTLSITTSW